MNLTWELKKFETLTIEELYSILQLRSEVFVVEQNCVYLDIDLKDKKALHLMGKTNNQLVAYARLFRPNDYFENASIGRVVIQPKYRSKKWGYELMEKATKGILEHFGETKITISAQLYLQSFYEKNGFIKTSDTYMEDDIPHIQMKKE